MRVIIKLINPVRKQNKCDNLLIPSVVAAAATFPVPALHILLRLLLLLLLLLHRSLLLLPPTLVSSPLVRLPLSMLLGLEPRG